jgi:NADPH:quinone reductase
MAKVVRFHELGGPEVLRLEEVSFEDAPASGELRLKVGAIGLNRAEVLFRSGALVTPKYPAVLGSECAGTIEAIGKDVTGFKIGDRVATIPGFTTIPGFGDRSGGHECAVYGEQAYVPAEMAVKMPKGMSFIEGASIWMQYSTAYNSIVDVAQLKRGEYVLLTAATSSVGISAIQIAKSLDAVPICTTRSRTKVAALKAQGVEHVIVTDEQDIPTEVARITGGAGVRVIYDPVGGKGVGKLLDALSTGGLLMLYGALDPSPATIDPIKGLQKIATVKFSSVFATLFVAEKRAKMTDFVLTGLASGALKPVIDRTFPLEEIVEAHRYLESNQHVGKIVVTVGAPR